MKPALLFYCQHSLGIGHLTRSFALAAALARHFRVVFLNGGPLPPEARIPAEIELIHLPPLGMDDGHTLVSRGEGVSVEEARRLRRALILGQMDACQPEIVLIELFPFGRKKFAFELLPLIRAARSRSAAVVCSLRDILVSDRKDQQRHDERARWLANRYFDAVIVHSDPAFARLEETFRPRKPLAVPVSYTGFVVPERPVQQVPARERRVLVSAGGGIVGRELFSAALEAHALLWPRLKLPMRLVAGPFLPEPDWEALRAAARDREGVELVRHVPDLVAEMRRADVSVSQCGYNTALDIVVSGVPALVVPYVAKGENEQTERARRLAEAGALRWMPGGNIRASELAAQIESLLEFRPSPAAIRLDGARHSAELLADLWRRTATQPRRRADARVAVEALR